MSEEFMETLALLPDDDIYYFLTTISNMALNRPKQDWLFIQTVTLQLFRVSGGKYFLISNVLKMVTPPPPPDFRVENNKLSITFFAM